MNRTAIRSVLSLLACGSLFVALTAYADAPVSAAAGTAAGTATLVTGRVSAATPAGQIRDVLKGGPVYAGETIITSAASYVNIEFSDGGRVLLRPESRFAIERYQYTPAQANAPVRQESAFFRLLKGGFRAVSGLIGHTRHEDYSVQTPVATIGIRGTDYEVRYCQGDCGDISPVPTDGLYAGVQSGSIALSNQGGVTVPKAGQFVFIANGAGTPPIPVSTRPPALTPLADPKTCN